MSLRLFEGLAQDSQNQYNGKMNPTFMDEKDGNIILSPLKNNPNVNELFGMFNDGRLSSEDFIKEKALEKEKEN